MIFLFVWVAGRWDDSDAALMRRGWGRLLLCVGLRRKPTNTTVFVSQCVSPKMRFCSLSLWAGLTCLGVCVVDEDEDDGVDALDLWRESFEEWFQIRDREHAGAGWAKFNTTSAAIFTSHLHQGRVDIMSCCHRDLVSPFLA